ncbi:hypothetical protein [Nostocoides sp. HKS02]|uniref:hypothetical protein n=1 Tax=Nostocoides sp. HKS02 TaxID=1813880 RepID=UPI0012B4B215|nr:hypothetical protein [Tetrasphaera sp. HKS02]QGN56690.1 hypothetical protein GKE56_00880 [Tetrasphaera sp. HKS02]
MLPTLDFASPRDGAADPRAVERWRRRRGLRRDDLVPLAIFVVARLVDFALLGLGGRSQAALTSSSPAYHVFSPTPSSPGLLGILANWDGQWYEQIALSGYPSSLPTAHGIVGQNAWAFYPALPVVCRALMGSLGIGFPVAAVTVNLCAGAVASVALHRLLRDGVSSFPALAAVLTLNAYAASPVLQVAYPEALALALVLLALLALRRRRYVMVSVAAIALGLTRPISLPLAIVVTVVVASRARSTAGSSGGHRQTPRSAVSAVVACWVAVVLWPTITAIATRTPTAYLRAQEAWPVNRGLLDHRWTSWLWQGDATTLKSALVGVIAVGAVLAVALRPSARRWGAELRTWALVYPLFVLLATRPGPSVVRLMLPAAVIFWPFPEDPARDESRAARHVRRTLLGVVVGLGLVWQYLWVTGIFIVHGSPAEQLYP